MLLRNLSNTCNYFSHICFCHVHFALKIFITEVIIDLCIDVFSNFGSNIRNDKMSKLPFMNKILLILYEMCVKVNVDWNLYLDLDHTVLEILITEVIIDYVSMLLVILNVRWCEFLLKLNFNGFTWTLITL